METFLQSLPGVIPVFLLVVTNGIFVAAEFALVRSLATKLKGADLKDRFGTNSAIYLMERMDRSIATTQLGITSLNLVLGWYGEQALHGIFASAFQILSEPYATIAAHSVATVLALTFVTSLQVILGELVAKSIAIRHPETTLRTVAGPIVVLTKIFHPVVSILNGSANLFLRLFGLSTDVASERIHTSGELSLLIQQSTAQGVLDKDEEEMLQGVFGFSETIAREVMTPRTDLVTIPRDASFREVISTISQSGFSRFPVIDSTVDNIIGILLSRDLLPVVERYVGPQAKPFSVKEIMRAPYFIPGTKSINELLKEFKQRKLHMAVVLDEHGGVDGAVTLEDIIEEIVGDIYDESDAVESDITIEADSGDVIVDGGVLVDDINEQFELAIPDGEYDTIAGFVMSSLGRIPLPGDQIAINSAGIPMVQDQDSMDSTVVLDEEADAQSGAEYDGLNGTDFETPRAILIVEKVTGNRIESIRLQQVKPIEHDLAREQTA